ncbi:hypothetical protein [Desulfovibrio sp. ZJ200]|uniref:hypothetical protein n=1 Tax=Desulfovibrio sp. ZJ200 TaxID=2709792 RepID=UPI0013ED5A6F|nr:hypothetical protein [Desulfovibrio sp. ZJ200]
MTFYESQRWHSGEKRGFRLNVRHVAEAAAFASAERFQSENALEDEYNGEKIISEIGYTIDNTTKTRAIFEINKGIPQYPEINVNVKMPEDIRRVHLNNMIYIADGPSDIPAFSLINKDKGSTFAIYPKGDQKAFEQVEKMRMDGRINMYAEADYRDNTTAYRWLCYKVTEISDRIRNIEKSKITSSISSVPQHLV